MRFAAGVALISAGLVIGSSGGAVAWADTDSDGGASESSSAGQSQGSEASSDGGIKAGAPTTNAADPVRTTLRNVTTAIQSLPKLVRQQSTAPKPAQPEPTAKTTSTDKSDATTDSDAASAESTTVAPENVVTSDPNGAGSNSHTTPLANISLPPVSSPSNPLPPVPPIVQPVANAVSAVANVALSVPGTVATISTSPTPVTDAITALQQILTDTITPVVQASSDLTSLLLGAAATIPVTPPVAGTPAGVGAGAATPTVALSPVKQLDPTQVPLFAGFPETANLPAPELPLDIASTALSRQLVVSGTQSTTVDTATQSALGEFIEHVVGALLAPASLTALAALALPGVLGLLLVGAAGMRFGYRQAKALLEVRISGIAAFAGAGPLGWSVQVH